MAVEKDYSELVPGDVVLEWGTQFRVEPGGVKSFERHGRTVWMVATVAVSEPSRVLEPFVMRVGDPWTLQGSAHAAKAQWLRRETLHDLTEFSKQLGKLLF